MANISRKENCWDNAPTAGFFRGLKHERLNYETFGTEAVVKQIPPDQLAFNGRFDFPLAGFLAYAEKIEQIRVFQGFSGQIRMELWQIRFEISDRVAFPFQ